MRVKVLVVELPKERTACILTIFGRGLKRVSNQYVLGRQKKNIEKYDSMEFTSR